LENLNESQLQTLVAQRIVKDAAIEDIPLVGDVDQMRWGDPTIVIRHYDYGKDLSLSEIRVIQQLSKVAARKLDCELHFTLDTLRFSVTGKMEKPGDVSKRARIKADNDQAVSVYMRKCRPHADLYRDVNDICAEWRYLNWQVNCRC